MKRGCFGSLQAPSPLFDAKVGERFDNWQGNVEAEIRRAPPALFDMKPCGDDVCVCIHLAILEVAVQSSLKRAIPVAEAEAWRAEHIVKLQRFFTYRS